MQHLIGFISMLVLTNLLTKTSLYTNTIYTIYIYLWFIVTTKVDFYWIIPILTLLFIEYFSEIKYDEKAKRVNSDENIPNELKNKISKIDKDKKIYLIVAIVLISLIGSYHYSIKKNNQYGGNFDPIKFMFCESGKCKYPMIYN